ncbi:MAG: DEAD/DEAH box helicase [Deltaproteobacteria bacterium]|nr:DEAD/DEAH box helicase [Deltaproteobacteria bacterium]
MNDFTEFELLPQLQKGLSRIGFKTPTAIQVQAIPHLMMGKDLVGIAQTGTGKTAAFGLPLLDLLGRREERAPAFGCLSLILAPTRELAQQVHDSIKEFARDMRISTTVIYGGVNQKSQVNALRRGVDIIVATPGRLEDLVRQGYVKLSSVSVLILDEADRMLEIGFMPAIKRIVELLPKERQTVMFSATMPKAIEELTRSLLKNPERIMTSPESTTVDRIKQQVVHLPGNRKVSFLKEILAEDGVYQALIFSRTKHGADKLMRNLGKSNFECDTLHSNKSQNARQRTLNNFKRGKLRYLIATDIATRGLDVDGVSHVINYDLPEEPESYVHRIGRTGRAGRDGIAISLCTPEETGKLKSIERTIRAILPMRNLNLDEGAPFEEPGTPEPMTEKQLQEKPRGSGNRNSDPKKERGNFNRRDRKPSFNSERPSWKKSKPSGAGSAESRVERSGNSRDDRKPSFNSERSTWKNPKYSGAGSAESRGERNGNSRDDRKPAYNKTKFKSSAPSKFNRDDSGQKKRRGNVGPRKSA